VKKDRSIKIRFLRGEVERIKKILIDAKLISSLAFSTDFTSQLNMLNKNSQKKALKYLIAF